MIFCWVIPFSVTSLETYRGMSHSCHGQGFLHSVLTHCSLSTQHSLSTPSVLCMLQCLAWPQSLHVPGSSLHHDGSPLPLCSLSNPSVHTEYKLSTLQVLSQYSLSTLSVCIQYSLSIPSVLTQYSLSTPSVVPQYSFLPQHSLSSPSVLPSVLPQYSLSTLSVLSQYSFSTLTVLPQYSLSNPQHSLSTPSVLLPPSVLPQ